MFRDCDDESPQSAAKPARWVADSRERLWRPRVRDRSSGLVPGGGADGQMATPPVRNMPRDVVSLGDLAHPERVGSLYALRGDQ